MSDPSGGIGMGFVPTKPPRGQKAGRETGILMTVIKALLSTASAAQRDGIKSQVEQEYKLIDKTLDALILNKQESLNSVMQVSTRKYAHLLPNYGNIKLNCRTFQAFRQICEEIDSAKQRIHGVKTNLLNCKMLLHGRREELERLWLEGIEHKHAMDILDQMYVVRFGIQ